MDKQKRDLLLVVFVNLKVSMIEFYLTLLPPNSWWKLSPLLDNKLEKNRGKYPGKIVRTFESQIRDFYFCIQ
jgi:hypothetical protein